MNNWLTEHRTRSVTGGACLVIIAVLIGVAGTVRPARAQYFGQNKVRYDTFDFKVLETEHFDVYFYPQERLAAQTAARMIERWYGRFSEFFGHELSGRQPLILYANQPDFQQTNTIPGFLGEATGGVTEALKRRIVLPFAGPLKNTDHVLGHELIHAFQYDLTGGAGGLGLPGALRMPLWFIEGMAEYLSLGPLDAHTAMWLRDAAGRDELPDLGELQDPRYFPYRFGHAFLAYIGGRYGDEAIARLLKASGREDIRTTLENVTGVDADSVINEWHAETNAAYDSLRESADRAERIADLVVNEERGGGTLNIAPVVSPDGEKLIFFSEKDLFTINLYLADAETGEVERTLVERSRDPHLEGLQFIESAGAWSPDGDRVVVAAVRKGKPVLEVIGVQNGGRIGRVFLPELGEALHPSWSPDGRSVAFSGLTGGMTDLFIYDIDADRLRRVTEDMFTDIQPVWSPDGTEIVFATDRFSTDLEIMDIGHLELATVNLETGEIQELSCFDHGKHINPAWSADGSSIYFVSDRTGVSNIYRRDVETGALFQLTNLYTGVSGVTALSPAMSSASAGDRVVFCAFEGGDYNIYRMDGANKLRGKPVDPAENVQVAALRRIATSLPPVERDSSLIQTYMAAPTRNLPPEKERRVRDYNVGFSLDYVAQPSFAVGTNGLGTQLGGGTALFWSDMLGNHSLVSALQVQSNGTFSDVGGTLGYSNYKYRWAFGGSVQRLPYLLSGYSSGFSEVDSEVVFVEEELNFRQTINSVSAFAQYPFSRTSRVEIVGGWEYHTFDEELNRTVRDAETGRILAVETEDLTATPSLNLFLASVAFVYDFSYLGITSPILGERYRLEVTPIFGDLTYYTVLGDYRRYVLPFRPLTLAFRGIHLGRYGRDSATDLLAPYFIGYQTIVRGYDSPSFSGSECTAADGDPCPVFNQLFGTRLAVVNAEARVPPFGLFGLGGGYYGFVPLEVALFFDAGVAWTPQDEAFFLGGERDAVKSYGVSLRLGLSRYVVFTFDFVNPIDRSEQGWYWQLSLAPGF